MRILLTGKDGQLGWELQRSLAKIGEIIAFDHSGLDLASPDQIVSRTREIRPHLIVNAAAYTSVDLAESEAEQAMAVNGIAPGILAEEARRVDALLVHYSTDYVFDGTKTGPYREDDTPHPINAYGRSKLAGEQAVRAQGGRYLIVRTSWVYAGRGRNFMLRILQLARERGTLRVVDDQRGTPTWARDIAVATSRMLSPEYAGSGTYNVVSAGETTWCGFARAILEEAGVVARVEPIRSDEFPSPARRPANSVLSPEKLARDFDLRLKDWRERLERCVAESRATVTTEKE